MFDEHETENSRAPSPWDPFLPSPPNGGSVSPQSAGASLQNGIPKLVPEIEEGNIEYKLKLTQISNARFARLVTQLKWRLLEGGGQAYYELGVADTGALIGLSRADLEESLETLEMMAGEIGASVIVVKEIEVPPTMAALADKESQYTDPDTGEWTRKMRRRPRIGMSGLPSSGGSSSPTSGSPTEGETDLTDVDEVGTTGLSAGGWDGGKSTGVSISVEGQDGMVHRQLRCDPGRGTGQSSPLITPIDDDLALFSMEPEHEYEASDGDGGRWEMTADEEGDGGAPSSLGGLEIAAVYKPRPMRQRTGGGLVLGATVGRHGKRLKETGWAGGEKTKEERAAARRVARDKRREERRRGGETGLVAGVEELHAAVDAGVVDAGVVVCVGSREARLIVEALVVRKMSIDEAELDFGRLALA